MFRILYNIQNKYLDMKLLFIFLIMSFFFQFAIAQNMHSNDIATIKSRRAASNDAIAKHDMDGIAKYWLDDFVQIIGRDIYQQEKTALWLHGRSYCKAIRKLLMCAILVKF